MGERAKNIGEEAEEKVWTFLSSLGYEFEDTNVEIYNIDGIAKSPRTEPDIGLAKPAYSPSGLVAFEVKQPNVTRKKVDKFSEKISKYNKEKNEKLKGGIYIADCKMSPGMLEYMRQQHIWGWGQKRTRLYREKVNALYYWSKKKAFVKEIPIGKYVSYLQIATPPPTRFKEFFHFSVICDDSQVKLSPKIVKQLMEKVRKTSINPFIELGISTTNVYFEFYSIGGVSKNLREEISRSVIDRWKERGISVDIGKFMDFRTFVTL